jgi:Tfp pilus assembly protein PilF
MMPRLLAYTLLGILLFVGYQLWSRQHAALPPPSTPPVAESQAPDSPASPNTQLSVTLSDPAAQPMVRQSGTPLTIPVRVSGSPHAAAQNENNELIQQGKNAEAEAKLQALPPEALNDPAMRASTSTLWNNLGVMRVKASGAAAGVPAYKSALAINPYNAIAHHNLVYAYWELRDPALTPELLEESIRLNPDNPLPHLALAELLLNKDDLAAARTHLERAKAHIAESPNLQAHLGRLIAQVEQTQKAEQKFLARESSHFLVKFDGDADHAVWNRVLEILEDAYREIGQQLGHFPSKPILVVLHTRETFHGATGGPAWSDGLYDPVLGRIKVPTQGALTDRAWLTRVLRHEYVHALLRDRMGGRGAIPQWLNEGLAMQLAGDPPPDIPELVRGQVTLVNLSYLEGNWGGLTPKQATVAYLEGNSATKYFIDRFGMEKMREVLGQLATGQPFPDAFKDRLFITYEDFQRRWIDDLNEKIKTGRM